jgi:hypothetical protein
LTFLSAPVFDGVFFQHFPVAVGIEIDARPGARVMDFAPPAFLRASLARTTTVR